MMMNNIHRVNTIGSIPSSRTQSPRVVKPSFMEGTTLEERDRTGRVTSRYRWGKLLGKGGFAKCYEGTDADTGAIYAIKVIDRASLAKAKMQSKLHSEIAIHRRMNHANIVRFYKTFQDDWYVYIILEKCSNQTLMEISRTRARFSTAETQHIMLQSIAAINYMHQEGVIHRDLKLGNMMMDSEMNVKIGDFGLAAELQYDGERKRTICGTPNYIAPEILVGAREGHSFEVDVWSLGVILYTLLVGEPPFQTNDVKTTYNRIKQCRFSFPTGVPINEHGKDLVFRILQSRPEKRPSLLEVRQHPFFQNSPSTAPLTLFTESQRRRMSTPTGAPLAAPATATATGKNGVREPLRQLWGNNQQQPASNPNTPRETNLKPDSARGLRGTAAPVPTAAASSRDRLAGSLPLGGSARVPVPSVNGWTSKPDSRPPSPRDTAAAPAPSSRTGSNNANAAPVPAAPHNHNNNKDEDEDKQHLTMIHDRLHRTFHGGADAEEDTPALAAPPVWVTDYADFSAKYGLAYRLSTGHTAVHYNDSTKMVWEPISNRAEYYARVKETVNGVVHAQDQKQPFHMDSFPEALNKKVTLIKYFKSYLTKAKGKKDGVEVVTCSPYVNPSTPLLTEPNMVSDMVYVKRWLLTDEAMIFRLSNKAIQVCFFDKAEIILSSETKVVTFTDAQGKRITIPLSAAASHGEEVSSRLKFTKDILSKLINNREL